MRKYPRFRLAVLALFAVSLAASAFARPSALEAKKPPLKKDFVGYGKTEIKAREDAVAQASAWMNQELNLGWLPPAQHLLDCGLIQFLATEEKELEEPMGRMKLVKAQVEINADQQRNLEKLAQQQVQRERMRSRQGTALLVLLGVVGFVAAVGGYLRLEEATKGYYTRLLRIAAIGLFIVIVLLLGVIA